MRAGGHIRTSPRAPVPRARHGFTLIEIMAVVLVLGLAAYFVIPNLGAFRRVELRNEAKRLAGHLEFARQRAIVTGAPHRVWLDLDGGYYRIEWQPTEPSGEDGAPPAEGPPVYETRGETPLPLAAPQQEAREFEPVPGQFGNVNALSDDIDFGGIETQAGFVDRGEAWIVFERDGTASRSDVLLEDTSGLRLALEVLPLADVVTVHHVD